MKRSLPRPSVTRHKRRRRGVARLFVFGSAFALSAAAVGPVPAAHAGEPQQAGQAAARVTFNIPEGTIASAAAGFESATGIRLTIANESLRDLPSPGVRGSFTPQQALDRMLAGTGVGAVFSGEAAASLDLRTTEFVSVEGRRPAVSSPKYTEPLVDTPQTVSVISSELFLQQGAQNLTEVLRNSPGITFNAGENGFATGMNNFSLRGFDTSGSVFVDGARDSGNYFRDVFNTEQVEVVKGPNGENGRSGAGGYVNLSTKMPTAGSFQRASFNYGFDGQQSSERPRGTLDVNQQVGDNAAVRLNLLWQDGGVPGRTVAQRNAWGVAPSFSLGLTGPTRLTVSYQHLDQDDVPDWGVPGALIEGMATYNADAGAAANRNRFYGLSSDYDTVQADSALARVEHVFSPAVRLSNQTRWSSTDREALYTVPTGYTPATRQVATQRQGYTRENVALTNLTNLNLAFDTGGLRHEVSSGLELTREGSDAGRFPTNGVLGTPASAGIDTPDANRSLTGLVGLSPIQVSEVRIGTVGVYAYDTINVNSRWQVNGGLRLDRYGVDIESRTAAGAPQGPDGYDRTDNVVSGKAGVVYKPSAFGSIYAAFGSGALPPASYLSNPDVSRDGDNAFPGWSTGQNSATSRVQRMHNYELGTKWNALGERLGATAAYFRTERKHIAMAGTVNGVANTFAGYADQVVQGVELGASGTVVDNWSVFGGVLLMSSERRHAPEVDAARLAANPADYGTATSTNGDQLAFTPKVTANLWTTYRLPLGVTVGGGFQYYGDSYLGRPDDAERIIPNGNAGILPSRTIVNALASYGVNRNLTLRFNVDNLTNAFYAASSNWNGTRVFTGPARAFLLSADVGF